MLRGLVRGRGCLNPEPANSGGSSHPLLFFFSRNLSKEIKVDEGGGAEAWTSGMKSFTCSALSNLVSYVLCLPACVRRAKLSGFAVSYPTWYLAFPARPQLPIRLQAASSHCSLLSKLHRGFDTNSDVEPDGQSEAMEAA